MAPLEAFGRERVTLRRILVTAGAVLTAVLATLLGLASPASAHATLDSTSPPAESVLDAAPAEILLTFTEAVDPVPGSIRLLAADGSEIDIGAITQDRGSDTLSATVPEIGRGTHVVVWRAVSADSHPISGAFTFAVGERTDTAPGLVEGALGEGSSSDAGEVLLGVGRWASFAGIAVLLGAPVVLAVAAREHARSRRARLLLGAAMEAAVLGTVLMLFAQAAVTDSTFGDVAGTSSGRWWLWRLGAIVVAGALALAGSRAREGATSTALRVGGHLSAAALLAVTAAGGHGISGRSEAGGYVATVVHLAAMAVWLGGIVALVVCVPRSSLFGSAARFSPLAIGSVVALAATGAVNWWRQAGSLDAVFDTTYGRWLLVKLVLVLGVVTLGGVSRWLVHAHPGDAGTDPAMRRVLAAEVVGMALVLAATAGLVSAVPPVDLVVGPASASAVQGNRIAQVVLDPAVAGGAELHVYISGGGGALDAAEEITVEANLAAQAIGPLEIPVVDAGPNHVRSSDANLPVAGTWTFTVTARYGEFEEVVFTTDLVVR